MSTRSAAGASRGLLQIGDVADRTHLSLRTVRHYDQVGLLPAAERSPGGFRLYTDGAVERLLLIRQMKPLEFTLEQMRTFLDAMDDLDAAPSPQRRRETHVVMAAYQQLVGERTAKLRERLVGAEALQKLLDDILA